MSSNLAVHASPSTNDLVSWNQNILSFDLDEIEAAADRTSVDQLIGMSLAALFGEQSPVEVDPCDEFHCSGYW